MEENNRLRFDLQRKTEELEKYVSAAQGLCILVIYEWFWWNFFHLSLLSRFLVLLDTLVSVPFFSFSRWTKTDL